MKQFFIIAGVALTLVACGSKNTTDSATQQEPVAEHSHEGCDNHDHVVTVVGVAQQGDAASGLISVVKLDGGETVQFDYSLSNPDKIAAWEAGDTVTVFIDHHHHGVHHHDSITAIKIGNHVCVAHDHEHGHDHAHGHNEDCEHNH